MRQLIAGNWKMHGLAADAVAGVEHVCRRAAYWWAAKGVKREGRCSRVSPGAHHGKLSNNPDWITSLLAIPLCKGLRQRKHWCRQRFLLLGT